MVLRNLKIITEGAFDCQIASLFLKAAGIPVERIEFIHASGSRNIRKLITESSIGNTTSDIVVLMDLDDSSNFEPEKRLKEKYNLEINSDHIFPAIPQIEAWLFSDIEAAKTKIRNKKRGEELLSRIPMPDEIPYPKQLARNLFNLNEKFELIGDEININIAMSRSPSLRKFIKGIASILGCELTFNWEDEYVRTSGRDVFSKLVGEVIPAETVIYKTLNGDRVTATEMSRHIQEGTETGMKYSVELLRVARDFIAREARRNQ